MIYLALALGFAAVKAEETDCSANTLIGGKMHVKQGKEPMATLSLGEGADFCTCPTFCEEQEAHYWAASWVSVGEWIEGDCSCYKDVYLKKVYTVNSGDKLFACGGVEETYHAKVLSRKNGGKKRRGGRRKGGKKGDGEN